ncbi:MAG: flavodoxin family protein [Clostridiales bacterium]|jgi:multimeric flavodoxin WrbA|nr:flavodoxin family protein [Clostridiales bacterium]
MKVLMINGSPNKHGCTFTALSEVSKVLSENKIEVEILHIGNNPIRGCSACGLCKTKGKCVFDDDIVNTIIEKAKEADGFVFGSPVHYAAPAGALCAVLDRSFYAGGKNFQGKPGAAVVSCRRAGSTAAIDRLNKYFTISHMPVISAGYWNMVHGKNPEQVKKDLEGLQIMRTLGANMAWILKCINIAKENGIERPIPEKKIMTSFINE